VAGRKEERIETAQKVRFDGGEGIARNVSANGTYFVTHAALQEGQPVKLMLDFDNFPSGPVEVICTARIVRVEQRGSENGIAASISSFEFRRIAGPGERFS